ncbi:MAG: DNA-processing protein DprA [Propionibacteriaceae bacterium]|jgi:DNA processing protein|nr:DNA-processing protein DprA [Propionibacteriaceae bacterium]
MTEERLARMGLMALREAGDLSLVKAVADFGVVDLWRHLCSGRSQVALAAVAQDISLESIIAQTAAIGASFLIPGDPDWPDHLAALSWSQPVNQVGGAPLGLWVLGDARLLRRAPVVAMVGARAATTYGERVASSLAEDLVQRGCVIASGGAYGVDAACHRGALAAGGVTIAVMAGGLANLYPSGNRRLLERIGQNGVLISEHPPASPPYRSRFLVRNRLIAALADVTVVVEAGHRSGAQNTVSWALSLHRPVAAVPGPVSSAMSSTPHRLIRDQAAVLVTSAEEIIELCPEISSKPRVAESNELAAEERAVIRQLSTHAGRGVDTLSSCTGLPPLVVLAAVERLGQAGLARESADGLWRLVP